MPGQAWDPVYLVTIIVYVEHMFFIASSAGHSWFLGWVLRVIMSQLFIHVHSSCHIPIFTPLDTGKVETLCFSHPFPHILPASLCNSTTLRTSSYSCGPGSCRPCSTRKRHSVYCLYSLSSAFLFPHFPLHSGGKSLAQIKKIARGEEYLSENLNFSPRVSGGGAHMFASTSLAILTFTILSRVRSTF